MIEIKGEEDGFIKAIVDGDVIVVSLNHSKVKPEDAGKKHIDVTIGDAVSATRSAYFIDLIITWSASATAIEPELEEPGEVNKAEDYTPEEEPADFEEEELS